MGAASAVTAAADGKAAACARGHLLDTCLHDPHVGVAVSIVADTLYPQQRSDLLLLLQSSRADSLEPQNTGSQSIDRVEPFSAWPAPSAAAELCQVDSQG